MNMKITLSKICACILALVMLCPALFSCAGGTVSDTTAQDLPLDTITDTEKSDGTDTVADTNTTKPDVDAIGVLDLTLADGTCKVTAGYTDSGVSLKMAGDGIENADSISYYISAVGATEIVD